MSIAKNFPLLAAAFLCDSGFYGQAFLLSMVHDLDMCPLYRENGTYRLTHVPRTVIMGHKTLYYELLLAVTKDGKWEDWVLYILNGIEQTAKETIVKIKRIRELLDKTIETVKERAPKIYSKELVETLFVNPYCKVTFSTDYYCGIMENKT